MKKLLFAGLLSLCLSVPAYLSVPAFAEMKISRTQGWQGTDDGVDGTWNNDGTYMEMLNETASTTPFRIALSGGNLIVGSTANANAQADIECGAGDKFFMNARWGTNIRTNKGLGTADEGAMVWDTDQNKLYIWTGSAWEQVTSS